MHVARYAWVAIAIVFALQLVGCGPSGPSADGRRPATLRDVQVTITLQTTTSPRDSGLLDHLLSTFKERNPNINVKVIAVGSGQAIANSRRGDGDVLIAHSPAAEQQFMDDGFGISRRPLMENDFIIVGPAADPAKVKGKSTAAEAFRKISEAKSVFVSRADESGTHVKEKGIWKAATIDPAGDWYIKAGIGMADALRMADEKQAYLLTDKGTYLAQKEKLKLVPVVEGDPLLLNKYSVIVVSSPEHPTHQAEATKFADFLVSPEGKKLIDEFGKEKYGESLFRAAK